MTIDPEQCAFCEDGYCIHTDAECTRTCAWAIKRYRDLSMRDYLDIYWGRKERIRDAMFRWLALCISLAAFVVSFLALKH